MTKLCFPLLASLALAACHDRPQVIAVRGAEDPAHTPGQMTVTGTAKLEVSPDCADLTMTLGAEDPRAGAATKDVEAKENALVARLRALGLGDKDLKLSSLELDPEYDDHVAWKLHAFRAQITITATTRDFSRLPALMEAGAELGATNLSSAFRRSDLDQVKRHLRDLALAAARDKATQTAKDLGIQLGRITSVSENAGGTMWNQEYFPQTANVVQSEPGGAALGGTLQPLTLTVTLGYELAVET